MLHQDVNSLYRAAETERQGRRVAFSDEFYRLVERSRIQSCEIELATLEEVLATLALTRRLFPVVSDAVATRVYLHNPECFRIVRREPFESSVMEAYLPLTGPGAAALVGGTFNGLDPDLGHICGPGEAPDAIYSWLTYAPGKMVAGLRMLLELDVIGQGVPIFSRPAHPEAAKIMTRAGFVEGKSLFPSAPDWLVVALSQRVIARQNVAVRVARSFEDISKVMLVRSMTYLDEQMCTYAEEFDGNDFCATHLLGEVDGEPAGCVRIRYFAGFAKLERLAVRPTYRRSRLMWQLVNAAFAHCARKGYRKLYAHAREDLVPAWERFGARLRDDRPAFSFSDVRFREMELDLSQHPHSLTIDSDPLVLIRPEGEWDSLGPIDRAQLQSYPERASHVQQLRLLHA